MTDLQIISVSKYENELELELCYCEAISSGECFESNNKRTKGNAYLIFSIVQDSCFDVWKKMVYFWTVNLSETQTDWFKKQR